MLDQQKILVLGADDRATLAVVRSLGRAGAEVHVACCLQHDPPAQSAYCFRRHPLPPLVDHQAWVEALSNLMRKERFTLVLPVSDDRIIIPLRRHAAELRRVGQIYQPNDRTFLYSYDKSKTLEMARDTGIPVPRYVVVARGDEAPREVLKWDLPLVLRPVSSFDLCEPGPEKWKARFVFSRAEFLDCVRSLTRETHMIVQQAVPGQGVGLGVLGHEGECLAVFQHLRLHESPSGSGSSFRRSTPLHPGMTEAVRRIAAFMHLSGVLMVEFKWNAATDDWWLIEVNGRFWGSLPLAVAAGADFPAWLVQTTLCGERSFPRRYDTNVYARNWRKDLGWFLQNLRADRSNPFLVTRPIAAAMKDMVRGCVHKEVSDSSAPDDPAPARRFYLRLYHRLFAWCCQAFQQFPLVRRKTHLSALSRWESAAHVLFLCHGNICRSPFAEEIARRFHSGKVFSSAGFHRQAGRSAPETARRVATEVGITLEHHRSRIVNRELVEQADLIIVFDARNMGRLNEGLKPNARRAIYFGSLAPRGRLSVADPAGSGPKAYVSCFRQIERTIASIGS
jgi:protein-tyrosine-phosphatase/predicted ATP-grasp superfamily ATP-dependent carboligase